MQWSYGRDRLSNFDSAETLEWLETNGLGGWASSTVSGAHSRRYHGLLVASTHPPVGRVVLLSRLDETLLLADGRVELATNRFPGTIHPRGHLHVDRFDSAPFPTYEFATGEVRLRKQIACLDGENTTLVLYELAQAPFPVTLELRPFFAGRDYHALTRANEAARRDAELRGDMVVYRQYDGLPAVYISPTRTARWTAAPDWWRDFEYTRERERGLDSREDLFTPGTLVITLTAGERLGLIVSTDDPAGRDPFELLESERRRRQTVVARLGSDDPLLCALARAADQFVVRRGDGSLRTVIAGYPWFTDWGRDTMIALPGLCLVTGAFDSARRILRAFAAACDQGMLPNRFPDHGEAAEYNTVDASLWFFVAAQRYLEATRDENFVREELLPVLREVLDWHRRGTRHGIGEDADGLLRAGEPGVQLTWMDAKVGDWVVTPRHGKPVEINALWYNALCILAGLERRFGAAERAVPLELLARRVKQRFVEAFWNADDRCLYDVLGPDGADASFRPNQIFALSLPHPLLAGRQALDVLAAIESRLLTPFGLRSLAPDDRNYVGVYEGDVRARDGAYHQGTVWSWLLGPYLTAVVRLRGDVGRRGARSLLERFAEHLGQAGLGTVSEIFDGDAPHTPRGCPAQAWSVAELLRAAIEDVGMGQTGGPLHPPAGRRVVRS